MPQSNSKATVKDEKGGAAVKKQSSVTTSSDLLRRRPTPDGAARTRAQTWRRQGWLKTKGSHDPH